MCSVSEQDPTLIRPLGGDERIGKTLVPLILLGHSMLEG